MEGGFHRFQIKSSIGMLHTICKRSRPTFRQRAQYDMLSPPRSLSVGARQKQGIGPPLSTSVPLTPRLIRVPAKLPSRWNAMCTPPLHCTCSRLSPASRTRNSTDADCGALGTLKGDMKPPEGRGSGICVQATSWSASHHRVGWIAVVRNSRNHSNKGAELMAEGEAATRAASSVSSGSCVRKDICCSPPGGVEGRSN